MAIDRSIYNASLDRLEVSRHLCKLEVERNLNVVSPRGPAYEPAAVHFAIGEPNGEAAMTKTKVLVTGATGTTGRRTVEILQNHGREVRAVVHKESPASERLKSLGAEVFVADLLDFHSIRPAFDDIGPAYFCFSLSPSAIVAASLFAQAAVEAEVRAIVNISQICARRESNSHAAFNHWIEERLLDRTGVPTTHLRPTFFAEWFVYPGHVAQINSGLVRFPFSTGKHAPIAGEDQARLIAAILQSPEVHAGKTYNLCGPEEHSYQEWTEKLSNILGREIRYEVTSDDETREIFAAWYGDFSAQHIVAVAKDYDNGLFAGTDHVIEKFTGKKPMGFEEYIGRHLSLYNDEKGKPVSRPASLKRRAF
jgi:NAD(P)H dehydrogenase (quinone)